MTSYVDPSTSKLSGDNEPICAQREYPAVPSVAATSSTADHTSTRSVSVPGSVPLPGSVRVPISDSVSGSTLRPDGDSVEAPPTGSPTGSDSLSFNRYRTGLEDSTRTR